VTAGSGLSRKEAIRNNESRRRHDRQQSSARKNSGDGPVTIKVALHQIAQDERKPDLTWTADRITGDRLKAAKRVARAASSDGTVRDEPLGKGLRRSATPAACQRI
jgi:hypothetical protein